MIKLRPLMLAPLLAYSVSACGTATASESNVKPTGTLHGSLVTAGGPAPGAEHPAAGTVTVTRTTTTVTVVQVENGSFSVDLPAGTYTLNAKHGGAPCRSAAVTITPGAISTAQVVCDVP